MADFSYRPGWWLASDGKAEGEYVVWRVLRDHLSRGEMIFSDRRVPGTAANVDHIVVASSGVWVIDAKRWKAMSVRPSGAAGAGTRLYCGEQDVTSHVAQLDGQVDPVARIVRDPSVAVRPAMVILPAQCTLRTGVRFRLGKAVHLGRVLICPPRLLIEQIGEPGPLGRDQVVHIGHRLDQALPPR